MKAKVEKVSMVNGSNYSIIAALEKNTELTSTFTLEADISLLNFLIPKSHFDCIWQTYSPGWIFGTVYLTLYSFELSFLEIFFKTASRQFSSFSCL